MRQVVVALFLVIAGAPRMFAADICPATPPPVPAFVPPVPYSPAPFGEPAFLVGNRDLWVGVMRPPWRGLRHKIFWWRPGFNGTTENHPNLALMIRPLNGNVTTSAERPATNAQFGDEWSMLIMVDFPEPGCWEVTGAYGGHTVTFVASVVP